MVALTQRRSVLSRSTKATGESPKPECVVNQAMNSTLKEIRTQTNRVLDKIEACAGNCSHKIVNER